MKPTDESILESMTRGHFYNCDDFRKVHVMTKTDLRLAMERLMNAGLVRVVKRNHAAAAYFRPAEEEPVKRYETKPMKLSREMLAAADRVGELRLHPSKY